MNKTKRNIMICAAVAACSLSLAAFAACGGDSGSTSLRTQLDTVDETSVSFNFPNGTFSFKAVENATYYRVYFYNVEEPNSDLDNYDYFKYTIPEAEEEEEEAEEEEADPDAPPAFDDGSSSGVEYDFETNDDGTYVISDDILTQSPTFSKRYNAYYYDEATDEKTYYEAGDTMTFDLPNDSISGGRYIIGIRAGGPLALYTLSEFCVVDTTLALKYVTPEVNSGDWSWSWSVGSGASFKDPSKYTEQEASFPMSGTTKVYEDSETKPAGNGMMFEIVNADTMYAANPSMEMDYYITDANGDTVNFTYYDLNMVRNDSNSLDYWLVAGYETNASAGSVTLGYSVYSHSGPTMFYAAYGYFYIEGLTVGTEYTLHISAEAPEDSTTAYSSEEGTFTFTYEIQTQGTT